MTILIVFRLFCPEIRNVAFFFSAISAQGRKNSKGKKTTNKDGEDSDENADEVLTPSQAASSATQEWISNHPTVINDKLRPSVEYWIALTTPNGAPANPITIHRALLDCDVDTTAKQVHQSLLYTLKLKKGQDTYAIKYLTTPCVSSTAVKKTSLLLKLHEVSWSC